MKKLLAILLSVLLVLGLFAGCGGGLGGWSVAIITVPYAYYKAFGDKELLREFYPKMKKYMS